MSWGDLLSTTSGSLPIDEGTPNSGMKTQLNDWNRHTYYLGNTGGHVSGHVSIQDEKEKTVAIWKVYIINLDDDGDPIDIEGEHTVLAKSESDAILLADRAEGKALDLEQTEFVAVKVKDI